MNLDPLAHNIFLILFQYRFGKLQVLWFQPPVLNQDHFIGGHFELRLPFLTSHMNMGRLVVSRKNQECESKQLQYCRHNQVYFICDCKYRI